MDIALRAVKIGRELATVDRDPPVADFQRGFERLDDARPILVGKRHGILDDFEGIVMLLDFIVTLLGEQFTDFCLREILRDRYRKGNEQLAAGCGKLPVD
jgi:hypothetical protein